MLEMKKYVGKILPNVISGKGLGSKVQVSIDTIFEPWDIYIRMAIWVPSQVTFSTKGFLF